MTNLSAQQIPATTAEVDVPDIGFSVPELIYMLNTMPGATADRSAEVLSVGPLTPDDVDIINGGGALLAHGLLSMNAAAEFELLDVALVVSYILTNAESWTVIGGATEEGGDMGVYVSAPLGALLAQPRALGTWWFILIDGDAPREEVVSDTAAGFADESEATGVYVRQITLDVDRTFSFRRVGSTWAYAIGTSEANSAETMVEDIDRDATFAALAAFMGDFPPTAVASE